MELVNQQLLLSLNYEPAYIYDDLNGGKTDYLFDEPEYESDSVVAE